MEESPHGLKAYILASYSTLFDAIKIYVIFSNIPRIPNSLFEKKTIKVRLIDKLTMKLVFIVM